MKEAELLFTHILGCDRISLLLNKGVTLHKDKAASVAAVLRRRIRGEPLQYILGESEFMGFKFKVNKGVLIPRPETEILVEAALEFAAAGRKSGQPIRILELGTGSGCIAVSLAKLLPGSNVIATDISAEAIGVAIENASRNNVAENIDFLQGDLFDLNGLKNSVFDMIVSNPPYVSTDEIEGLQPEVRFEPKIALDGGRKGLEFYRAIARDCAVFLKENGLLMLEMGFAQKDAVKDILEGSGNFTTIKVIKDYGGIDRVIIAKKV